MSNRSELFAFFRRIGVFIYSVEDDLNAGNTSALLPLSEEETKVNRRVIASLYGADAIRGKNRIIVKTLNT